MFTPYVYCRCYILQLAALNAGAEHTEVKRVLGTLLTIWKAFHYSPKKAEKLADIQAELQAHKLQAALDSCSQGAYQTRLSTRRLHGKARLLVSINNELMQQLFLPMLNFHGITKLCCL